MRVLDGVGAVQRVIRIIFFDCAGELRIRKVVIQFISGVLGKLTLFEITCD